MAVAPDPCPACRAGLHHECWASDPPQGLPLGLDCPCCTRSQASPWWLGALLNAGYYDREAVRRLVEEDDEFRHLLFGPTDDEMALARADLEAALELLNQ
jgi:hypothetical protein